VRRAVFTTPVRDALDSAVIGLTASGVEAPRLDAEVLLAHVLGIDRTALFLDPLRGVGGEQAGAFRDLVLRRQQHEPVAYLTGWRGFRHLDLRVDRRVLVPRPETEHLVEAALTLPAGARVADVGTGSGAVALALKHERPDLVVAGTDSSDAALEVARANASRLGLDVRFVGGDLLAGLSCDAVVSNPPYVADGDPLPPDVAKWEPPGALFAGPDGLDVYRRLAPAARDAGARFAAFEVGEGQAEAVGDLLTGAGFAAVAVMQDLAGIDRVVIATC
jgi:release factor glutamine methyltransferase